MTTSVRRLPGWAKAVAALVLVLAVLFAGIRLAVLPGIKDLFGTETHDRSGPALLKSIQYMSRYDAASGNFQVVVDLDKDAKFLPDAIRGTRTLYVGAGTVDAYVDLGRVGEKDVTVGTHKGKELTIQLANGGTAHIRYVPAGGRLYKLTVLGPHRPPDAAAVAEFFDSFEITR